jgi:hypothetical protein
MPNEPEKSTNQLAVWWHLVDILEQLGAVWQDTRAATGTVESVQLPANLAVALVRSGGHGAEVAAGVAAVLAQQADSGGRFRQLASAARAVDDGWPRRDHSIDLGHDATSHNGVGLRSQGFGVGLERGGSDA